MDDFAVLGEAKDPQYYWVPACWWKLTEDAQLGAIYLSKDEAQKECEACRQRHGICQGSLDVVRIEIRIAPRRK